MLSLATTRAAERGTTPGPAATITTALLLPHDRIARAPLTKWAEKLSGSLAKTRETIRKPGDFSQEIAWVANNAALIAAHEGATSMARELCERQIRWHIRLSRRSADPVIAGRSLQPWINLGRLEAQTGSWQTALDRLARLMEYRAGRRFDLGCGTINGSGWRIIAPEPEGFHLFLKGVYVVDSLKALLVSHRYAETLAFASAVRPDCSPGVSRLIHEASAVAACRMGEHEQALAIIADTPLAGTRGWERAVLELRKAEIHACAGDLYDARAALLPLARVVRLVSAEKKSELRVLYVISRIAAACAEAGLDEEARGLAGDAYEGARAAGDEAFEIESLRVLAAASLPTERARWTDELRRVEKATGYRRYRRDGPSSGPDPARTRLYDELLNVLS